MSLTFIRIFFLSVIISVGYFVGSIYQSEIMGTVCAGVTGVFLVGLEMMMKNVSLRGLSSMVFGLLLGIFMAKLVADVVSLLPVEEEIVYVARVVLTLIFSYLGAMMAMRGKDEFHLIVPYVRFKRQDAGERIVLLDTSAIIDARVFDIYKTCFFDDRLVVPRFVLHELQALADSKDEVKRAKGRRGLDIVDQMQKNTQVDIKVHEDEFTDESGVDAKLVRLARMLDARICTVDQNLARVAAIQDVGVLNVHELMMAMRPRLMVGDHLELALIREGKESGQTIAYTIDGTMVVVADSQGHIGQQVRVEVTSLLQTQTGEMIFARIA